MVEARVYNRYVMPLDVMYRKRAILVFGMKLVTMVSSLEIEFLNGECLVSSNKVSVDEPLEGSRFSGL